MNMIKLNCPSCNGSLEIPDNLGVAHCMYCGTRILLQKTDSEQEKKVLEHYIELKKVAIDGNNYEEALRYCNSILEIDPNNIEAWIHKAISVCHLQTSEKDRYHEAMEYLKKAEQIAPDNNRIEEVRKELTYKQGNWLCKLGVNEFNFGQKQYDSIQAESFLDISRAEKDARAISREAHIKGMTYFLEASSCIPDDPQILRNIADAAKKVHWIDWSPQVHEKIEMYNSLLAKNRN
jgi:tetratricopeptide (TPR) repeat protein